MALLPPPFVLLVEQSVYMYLQLIKDEEYWSAGVLVFDLLLKKSARRYLTAITTT
jgi:hypothetical protein